jgi:hypothetical protein
VRLLQPPQVRLKFSTRLVFITGNEVNP